MLAPAAPKKILRGRQFQVRLWGEARKLLDSSLDEAFPGNLVSHVEAKHPSADPSLPASLLYSTDT